MRIYLNSKYVNASPSEFNQLLPGNLSGRGVFETLRMYKGRVFAFDEHMDRLAAGLRHFGLRPPLTRGEIEKVINRLSRLNSMVNARVRVIIWRNSRLNISVSLERLKLPNKAMYRRGYRVMSAPMAKKITRHCEVKSVDYKFFRSAYTSAAQKGFNEAVFFNNKGHLVEGSRTNIFFSKNGSLFTPSLQCGCLNGITRMHVIRCARGLGIRVKFVKARRDELLKADEAFLTGSTLEIMPVESVDHKPIGNQRPGAITSMIQERYAKTVKETLSI